MIKTKYCICSIFLSDGEGLCLFCKKPLNPLVIKAAKTNTSLDDLKGLVAVELTTQGVVAFKARCKAKDFKILTNS